MSNSSPRKRRPAPLSVRLSDTERAVLHERAGDLPLSTYVKAVLFAEDGPRYRKAPKAVSVDRELIARVLAVMGASRLASNLAQIARQANLGSLYFDEETKADLKRACDDVRALRALLLRALGKEVSEEGGREPLASTFGLAAAALEPGP